jgi:hypothetical protein
MVVEGRAGMLLPAAGQAAARFDPDLDKWC